MLEFVHDYMAWWHPGPSGMTPEEIAATVHAIVEAWDASDGDLEELRRDLNEFMGGLWQIEWWGQFGELVRMLD